MSLSIRISVNRTYYNSHLEVKLYEDTEMGENEISSATVDIREIKDAIEILGDK